MRAKFSGSCRFSQSSFGAVKPGMAMMPAISRKVRHRIVQLIAFGRRASVIPEDRRSDRARLPVENDGAVHLPGKADGTHVSPGVRRCLAYLGKRCFKGGPPICRILLRPARPRSGGAQGDGDIRKTSLPGIYKNGFKRRSADVDSEDNHPRMIVGPPRPVNLGPYSGLWQTASMLCPSGSSTNAP